MEKQQTTQLVADLETGDTMEIANEPGSGVPVVDASGRVVGYATVGTAGHVMAEVDEDGIAAAVAFGVQPMSIGGKAR